MQDRIVAELTRIEKHENVRVLYAVESGSRAWGFESRDSDYDVRFLYVRSVDDYLSVEVLRDVIEYPIDAGLDINGWDLRKALSLLRKSNPSLLEWLHSPIVYREQYSVAARLCALMPVYFSASACLNHYLSLARGQYKDLGSGDRVRAKRYFYSLRAVLACGWLERRQTMPPIALASLLAAQLEAADPIVQVVSALLQRKQAGDELDDEPRVPALDAFLEERLAHFNTVAKSGPREDRRTDHVSLNDLFRSMLREAWQHE